MFERTQKGKLYQSLKQNISDSSSDNDGADEDDDDDDDDNNNGTGEDKELAVFGRQLRSHHDFEMFSTLEPNDLYHSDEHIQFIDGKPIHYSVSQLILFGFLVLLLVAVLVGHYLIANRTSVRDTNIWNKEIPKFELVRHVKYVDSSRNLILIYENSKWDIIRDSGLICIDLVTANQTWYYRFMQNQLPQIVNCSLADFNDDNQTDCLLFHDNGLLQIIDASDGTALWSLVSQMPFFLKKITFPILVRDINNDRINDLILVVNYKRIVLVDGQNGELLLDPIDINECFVIKQLTVRDHSNYFEYYCDDEPDVKQVNYKTIWRLGSVHLTPIDSGGESAAEAAAAAVIDDNKFANLTYKTIGSCGNYTYNCSVNYRLENVRNETIWSLNLTNSVSMRPLIVMGGRRSTIAAPAAQNIFLKFWTFSNREQTKNFHVNYFNETILYLQIVRNYLTIDFRVRNVLQTRVMQLCRSGTAIETATTTTTRPQCQPELFFFKDSLLFDERTMDAFSFSSSYRKLTNNRSDFQLFSTITRIQLLH